MLVTSDIRDNIKYFGGNPESVTITGLSAGGASVHLHYLSPLSKDLFHRGFSQSRTSLVPYGLKEYPLKKAEVVGKHLQCPINSTRSMVDCLRNVDGKELMEAMKQVLVFVEAMPITPFGPVIEKGPEEGGFLAHHPYKLLKEGKTTNDPWVTSNVRDEGIYPTAFFVATDKLAEMDSRWDELLPFMLDIQDTVDGELKKDVVTKVRKLYLDDEPVSEDNEYAIVRMFSDRHFFIDGEKAARLHANVSNSSVYYYFFTYVLQQPFIVPGFRKGVSHCDDGRLLFKMFGTPKRLEAEDEKMVQLFTEFITSYAKTNKPRFGDKIGAKDLWDSFLIKENDKITNLL
nr:venom carboxylesterase-6-like [Leptinotarsa decemlineata]